MVGNGHFGFGSSECAENTSNRIVGVYHNVGKSKAGIGPAAGPTKQAMAEKGKVQVHVSAGLSARPDRNEGTPQQVMYATEALRQTPFDVGRAANSSIWQRSLFSFRLVRSPGLPCTR